MADEPTPIDETPDEQAAEQPAAEETPAEQPAEAAAPQAEEAAEAPVAEEAAEAPVAEEAAEAPAAEAAEEAPAAARAKPAIPGADLEVDIVGEGEDPLGRDEGDAYADNGAGDASAETTDEDDEGGVVEQQPIAAMIELAADARYSATGKRKRAVGRVILRPGNGEYIINGKSLGEYFPRETLQRTIRQPLETVGYEDRMDVVARMHGGGVSAQADALRHGISKALLEADPNLRGELKRRGFLTRDSRAKERKKAGLKKARKKPQFSKR